MAARRQEPQCEARCSPHCPTWLGLADALLSHHDTMAGSSYGRARVFGRIGGTCAEGSFVTDWRVCESVALGMNETFIIESTIQRPLACYGSPH